MKKIILVLSLFFVTVAGVLAQGPYVYPLAGDSPALNPSTTVKVYLTVERDVVRTGPYARYSQKYMGVIAPLADRTDYTIVSARLDYADPEHKPAGVVEPQQVADNEFSRVHIDRTSDYDKTAEEMARDAANTIFQLRKQRLDILTGDAGELYPGGVGAALSEISRLEEEYLALFLGKRTRRVQMLEFDVMPIVGKSEYEVCRFSQESGVGAEGAPVVLALKPDGAVHSVPASKSSTKGMIPYKVADFATCTLSVGGSQLASARIPIFQFGGTVLFPEVGVR